MSLVFRGTMWWQTVKEGDGWGELYIGQPAGGGGELDQLWVFGGGLG